MVAVCEGKDGALFETGRIGADKKNNKKTRNLIQERNTKVLLCEPQRSDWTTQQGCILRTNSG